MMIRKAFDAGAGKGHCRHGQAMGSEGNPESKDVKVAAMTVNATTIRKADLPFHGGQAARFVPAETKAERASLIHGVLSQRRRVRGPGLQGIHAARLRSLCIKEGAARCGHRAGQNRDS
jgi:hypothetical protein